MSTTTVKVPLSQRINPRVLIFAAVILLVIGYPLYIFISESVTGGVHDYGSFKLVDLKAMSNFEMDQYTATADSIPPQWRALDGQKVALDGEIWDAQGAGDKLKKFQLCYSIAKCCFNGPPKVQHFVDSTVADNASVNYSDNLVRVTGTLHVKVKHDDGSPKITSIYQLDVDKVEPR